MRDADGENEGLLLPGQLDHPMNKLLQWISNWPRQTAGMMTVVLLLCCSGCAHQPARAIRPADSRGAQVDVQVTLDAYKKIQEIFHRDVKHPNWNLAEQGEYDRQAEAFDMEAFTYRKLATELREASVLGVDPKVVEFAFVAARFFDDYAAFADSRTLLAAELKRYKADHKSTAANLEALLWGFTDDPLRKARETSEAWKSIENASAADQRAELTLRKIAARIREAEARMNLYLAQTYPVPK